MNQKPPKTLPRLYVTSALGEGLQVTLEKPQTHYLRAVLRLDAGKEVRLFNGSDGEWLGRIEKITKKTTELICHSLLKEQTEPRDLWYLFAPLKHARLDYIAQKATEMGASHLRPVKTAYTQVSRIKEERISANAVEAAEQCNLLSVPEIGSYVSLEKIIDTWPEDRALIFCHEGLDPGSPLDHIKELRYNSYAVLIGPEGGFSPDEITLLESKDFVIPISLGPRILRADTAGVAALALIQATIGDW